ncbi:MAG: alpha/beta hydrolase-fold protein [Planctomycetaceae bacterium]
MNLPCYPVEFPADRARWLRYFAWVLICGVGREIAAAEVSVRVRFDAAVHQEPFSGRVYLFTSAKQPEPRRGPNWFAPEQFFSMDVADWQPGSELVFGPKTAESVRGHPQKFSDWRPAGGRIQAVIRFNPWERDVGRGAGNGFSPARDINEELTAGRQELVVDQLVPAPVFEETAIRRLVALKSGLLSDFYHRTVLLRAAVLLPSDYAAQPQQRFPVVYVIPGFTGTHHAFPAANDPSKSESPNGVQFIRVILNPECPFGHHVFADSANNGPWGQALIEELIPEVERRFRTFPHESARFVTGHSSGGWSSLWLQVAYPDVFGGVWSTAPDPVDFRDFQQIDIYRAGENVYRAPDGSRRPLARKSKTEVALWYDDFDHMEETLGPGGQLFSFEAVFSPRGDGGLPLQLWNRTTGAINPAVAQAWEAYDIRLMLERNWARLGSRLAGKLHIFMGDQDTFYLEGSTRLLQNLLKQLGSDAVVEIHPDQDHRTLLTDELQKQIRQQMTDAFLRHHPPK